jgi:hypothetical protein
VTGRRGKRPKQLFVKFKQKQWRVEGEEEALNRALWSTGMEDAMILS